MFDAFADAGGTFVDTADMYAAGQSERILADLISRDRDHFVLATQVHAGRRQTLRDQYRQ